MASHSLTKGGTAHLLDYGDDAVQLRELHLFVAGPDPTLDSLYSDFTEAAFPGYAPITLPGFPAGSWNPVTGRAEADWGIQTWTLSADLGAPLVIEGLTFYDQFLGILVFATNEPPFPQTVWHAGDTVNFRFLTFAVPV